MLIPVNVAITNYLWQKVGRDGSTKTNGRLMGSHFRLGVLVNNRLRCFAHGACYHIETGDIEDHPGHGHLPSNYFSTEPEFRSARMTRIQCGGR